MWGLEYLLLFGLPGNKLELVEGQSRCAFPFLDRDLAEAHFQEWADTLCRWKGLSERPAVKKASSRWKVEVNGFILELRHRPVELRVPLETEVFLTSFESFWRHDLWEGGPEETAGGWLEVQRHADVVMNLWQVFGTFSTTYGGMSAGGVDVVLSPTAAVSPDQYYFRAGPRECMIGRDYFHGTPDLIAEVLAPATRAIDRGPRKELYRRAGVPSLWILDPETETVELYVLKAQQYDLLAKHGAGERFRVPLFPDEIVAVDALFDTQWKRHPECQCRQEPEPTPSWLIPRELRLGAEHLLLLGHPDRRREIWDNRSPCVLALGSEEEARQRFQHFREDLCSWEQVPVQPPAAIQPGVDVAEMGRFRLIRRGRHVSLEVAVDGRKYRELLEVWCRRDAWDWGEKDQPGRREGLE